MKQQHTDSPAFRLRQMGCGNEMVRCQIERGNIQVMLNNVAQEYKYLRYALQEKIYMAEIVATKKAALLKKLITIEPLVNKFHELYMDKYSKLKKSLQP